VERRPARSRAGYARVHLGGGQPGRPSPHRRLGSRAQAYYGDIYGLPDGLGRFDVVMFGMILSHLRDPFQPLYSASRLADAVIVTNQTFESQSPLMKFVPDPKNPRELKVWWALSSPCIERMLATLGFTVEHVDTCNPRCLAPGFEGHQGCMAFVARRVPRSTVPPSRHGFAAWASDRVRDLRWRLARGSRGRA
jgi:hypothetical protein